ncbi:N-carbamoylputrescine amidase / Omega amidase [Fimbriiglobus ruber]|uniref:N-carbamoylputrescine amidase / Omega amidase n=1 Tax=Fimbriiglobus ruber TaxID=1908690 RepID=A0A225E0H8_9BACT|nr:N-carbamoylputrescine amidase / Omega amidase [Fimbriiglobus ruber]
MGGCRVRSGKRPELVTGPDIPTRMGTMSPTPDRHARIEALLTVSPYAGQFSNLFLS